jgi:hypothetical protein
MKRHATANLVFLSVALLALVLLLRSLAGGKVRSTRRAAAHVGGLQQLPPARSMGECTARQRTRSGTRYPVRLPCRLLELP